MWVNWGGDQRCAPARTLRPRDTDEVAAAVCAAGERGEVVRVAGAGHSFSDAVLTDGTLLSLDALDQVLHHDATTDRVRVQAGIRLGALSEQLAARGLALENMGDVDVQSLAGALATATHGTGGALRNLSAQVTAMQLVDGRGVVREVDGGDELKAARVAVGALGVVTEVELQCVPRYTLRGVDQPLPLAAVLDDLDAHVAAHRHFEFFAFPHADTVLARANDVTDAPPHPRGRAATYVEDTLLGNHAFGAVQQLARRRPAWAPALARATTRALSPSIRVDRSDRVFASRRSVRFTEMEYALPREHTADVLRAFLDGVARDRVGIAFPVEVRFVAGDDAFLSPAHERETGYIAVHVPRGVAFRGYMGRLEALAAEVGGRPHWGKRHFLTARELRGRYPAWDAFAAVRADFDPDGRFANAYVRRTLGAVRQTKVLPSPR